MIAVILLPSIMKGQTVVLDRNVEKDTAVSRFGPNMPLFTHLYIGFSLATPPSETGAKVKYGLGSNVFRFGVRYKRKVTGIFSTGFDLEYRHTGFTMAQENGKLIPDSVLHEKETYSFYAAGAGVFLRFNFDPHRGNFMGKYIDLYAAADYNFVRSYTAVDKLSTGEIFTGTTSRLKYIEPAGYYASLRLGFSRFLFSATYRLSGYFKAFYNLPELPRINVGVEVGFY